MASVFAGIGAVVRSVNPHKFLAEPLQALCNSIQTGRSAHIWLSFTEDLARFEDQTLLKRYLQGLLDFARRTDTPVTFSCLRDSSMLGRMFPRDSVYAHQHHACALIQSCPAIPLSVHTFTNYNVSPHPCICPPGSVLKSGRKCNRYWERMFTSLARELVETARGACIANADSARDCARLELDPGTKSQSVPDSKPSDGPALDTHSHQLAPEGANSGLCDDEDSPLFEAAVSPSSNERGKCSAAGQSFPLAGQHAEESSNTTASSSTDGSRLCESVTGPACLPPGDRCIEPSSATSSPGSNAPRLAYPTDSRERQKAKEKQLKEAGITPIVSTKKKYVEKHYDDCGADTSSIETASTAMLTWEPDVEPPTSDSDGAETDGLVDGLCQHMLWGSESLGPPLPPVQTYIASSAFELMNVLFNAGPGIDVVELCGGAARTSTVSVRRQLTAGPNFDLMTGTDLNEPREQHSVYDYIKHSDVLVTVMAPTCKPFGSWSHINRVANYNAWQASYDDAAPHGRFCGEIALLQLGKCRHFLNEQPYPSDLYYEEPWPEVLNHSNVLTQKWDRCMTGLVGSAGIPVKKTSEMVASHLALLQPFANKGCNGSHDHEWLSGSECANAQLWTWTEASLAATGIAALKRYVGTSPGRPNSAYPEIGTGPGDPDQPEPEEAPSWKKCPGCLHRRAKDDVEHTRVRGECRHPDVQPIEWSCRACQQHWPRYHDDHTHMPQECRWAAAPTREGHKRKGAHPRPPRVPASDEPTAGREAEGPALGRADEARAEAEEANKVRKRLNLPIPEQQEGGSSSSASGAAPRQGRGPDLDPRERRTWTETATGPETPSNWTEFDIGRVLRALRSGSRAAQQRIIRKLHMRWWHAPAETMRRCLAHAGLPTTITDLVQPVVDTCSVCRKWTMPLPQSVASVSVAEQFNIQVECDIMFYLDYNIFHCICRCTRWHSCIEVSDKETDTLIKALVDCWVRTHGPMKELIVDGESAIAKPIRTATYLDRQGIQLQIRAPNHMLE